MRRKSTIDQRTLRHDRQQGARRARQHVADLGASSSACSLRHASSDDGAGESVITPRVTKALRAVAVDGGFGSGLGPGSGNGCVARTSEASVCCRTGTRRTWTRPSGGTTQMNTSVLVTQ